MTLIASIITFSKNKILEKKYITLDPRHGTLALDMEPSTLDPRQKDRLYLAFNDFAFFKQSFYRKRRLLKRVPYLFIFVIRENEILIAVIRDSLFFSVREQCERPPLYDPHKSIASKSVGKYFTLPLMPSSTQRRAVAQVAPIFSKSCSKVAPKL